jgi:glutathionyl-hydroquinone reductase
MYTSTQQVDDRWEEYFSKSDSQRERFSAELLDIKMDDLQQQWYDEYMTKVWSAGFGTDEDAYEAYWKRLNEYSTRCHI